MADHLDSASRTTSTTMSNPPTGKLLDYLGPRDLHRWSGYALFLAGMWAAAQGWWWLCVAVLGRWVWEGWTTVRRARTEKPYGPGAPPEVVGSVPKPPIEDCHRELLHVRCRDIGLEMGDLMRVATRAGGPELAAELRREYTTAIRERHDSRPREMSAASQRDSTPRSGGALSGGVPASGSRGATA